MPVDLTKLWFSQASVSAWQDCPLKFKYRYVDGLYWPLTAGGKISENIERGRKFHLLAQRYFGGGAASPSGGEPLLATWLGRLQEFLPLRAEAEYRPEQELRLAKGGLRLLAKYDLLLMAGDRATIYDWKTDGRPPGQALASSVQTRFYLSLLASSPLLAGRELEMVYWNPRFPHKPLAIGYSAQRLQQDWEWITRTLGQIMNTDAFPATGDVKKCRFCEYRPVCRGRDPVEGDDDLLGLEEVDWEKIQEIALEGVNFT